MNRRGFFSAVVAAVAAGSVAKRLPAAQKPGWAYCGTCGVELVRSSDGSLVCPSDQWAEDYVRRRDRNAEIAESVMADYQRHGEVRLPADMEDCAAYLFNESRVSPRFFQFGEGIVYSERKRGNLA